MNKSFFSLLSLSLSLIFLTKACPPSISKEATKYTEDCYPDRKTEEKIANIQGIVRQIAGAYILIVEGQENRRFQACNLEESFKKEELHVIFNGLVKEIFPTERRIATPFVLTAIQISR